jgi:hypothetical protein
MRCACRRHEIPSQEPNPFAQATPGINDHSACWRPHLADAQQPPSQPMSIEAWRRLWLLDKLRQNRLFHFDTGLQLRKPPHRNTKAPGAAYGLGTATYLAPAHHRDVRISTADEITFEEVEKSFLDDAARAEVMDYLKRAYGPRFVGKMIKHLPGRQSRLRPDR